MKQNEIENDDLILNNYRARIENIIKTNDKIHKFINIAILLLLLLLSI